MIDTGLAEFLEGGGRSQLVATVSDDGEPRASRAWGITVVGDDPPRLRVLLSGDDPTVATDLRPGARIAVTATDVATQRSLQVKGRIDVVEPANYEDRARATRHENALFAAIRDLYGTDWAVVERMRPSSYLAGVVTIAEVFDQTPGPRAGAVREAGS